MKKKSKTTKFLEETPAMRCVIFVSVIASWVTDLTSHQTENGKQIFFPGFPRGVDTGRATAAGSSWPAAPAARTWMAIETPTLDPSHSSSQQWAWMTRKWRSDRYITLHKKILNYHVSSKPHDGWVDWLCFLLPSPFRTWGRSLFGC